MSDNNLAPTEDAAPGMVGPARWYRIITFLPYLVMTLSLVTTWLFWSQYDQSLAVRSQTAFDDRTQDIANRFFNRMTDDEEILRGAAGLFNASENVTRDEWRRYVASLALGKNYTGFQGIGFSEVVRREDKDRHIRRVRAEGYPSYRIWPEGERKEYTSIVFLEPFDWRNQRAFGYDMFSEPVRREAMGKARDGGTAAVTGPVILMQETEQDRQTGILMYQPVYNPRLPLDTVAQRRAAIKGYAYSPIRVKDFMSATFPKPPMDVGFRIFTGTEPKPVTMLFDSVSAWDVKLPDGYKGGLQKTLSLQKFGRHWLITFQSLPGFGLEGRKNESRSYLIGGVTVSLLLGVIAFMLRSAHASALAAARALKESRERYRQLSEDSPAHIATFLPDGTITYVNPAFAHGIGRTQDELVGVNIFGTLLPDFQVSVQQGLAALSPQHPTETHEEARLAPDKSIIWHQWTNRAIFDEQGKIAKIQGVGQDITDRKRAEEERARLEQQMVQAQKLESLGLLAGGVAHDFNNILTAIIGNVDLSLMKLPEGSPVADNLHQIEKAATRAAYLAKQMLAYSGKGRFIIEKVDLNRVIVELRNILEASISRNADLVLKLQKPLPAVEADANQVRQILMNLAMNASEAIGEDSGAITISTGSVDYDRDGLKDVLLGQGMAEGSYVFLEVADTGCGMEKEVRGKIFDPFFTTKFTGRGLGLAAVHGIVRGHKGGMKISSEPGKGSRFTVLLPASGASTEDAAPESRQDDWKGEGKILLVDDEESVRGIGTGLLSELGFTTVLAGDGREALAVFKDNRDIRAVILDLTMPRMDGQQCFRELRLVDPGVKVIMSSGFSEQDVVQKFAGQGLAGFIQKPYNLRALREIMRKI
ncbi:MAG TPA: hybrid sensor histidine kinase/response regulator [Geobacter sp.]|nr:hybrid sensor histidine kinase/response regulator [Geobacter sp.]